MFIIKAELSTITLDVPSKFAVNNCIVSPVSNSNSPADVTPVGVAFCVHPIVLSETTPFMATFVHIISAPPQTFETVDKPDKSTLIVSNPI